MFSVAVSKAWVLCSSPWAFIKQSCPHHECYVVFFFGFIFLYYCLLIFFFIRYSDVLNYITSVILPCLNIWISLSNLYEFWKKISKPQYSYTQNLHTSFWASDIRKLHFHKCVLLIYAPCGWEQFQSSPLSLPPIIDGYWISSPPYSHQ